MIALETFAGKRVAVFGLGGSGLATAHALAAGGAHAIAFDDSRERVVAADAAGLPTGDLRVADFAAFDALVLSPGVPLTHPAPHWTVERAHAAGIPVIGDVGLYDRERRARLSTKLVAITGTNGKSTTTALTGHILGALGERVEVGGNIGRPVLDLSPDATVAVVECSSYQIDLAPTLAADVGVLLNLSPDHIDRHGTFANYAAVKERLVAGARQAVVGVNDLATRTIGERLAAAGKPVRDIGAFDLAGELGAIADGGVGAAGRNLFVQPGPRRVGTLDGAASLRGWHNAQNAAAAIAVAVALGHDAEDAARHLATFPGLAHRMEIVGEADGVLYVNDSKATNADSTSHALASFERIHWIAGGRAKEGGVLPLLPFAPRIARAYLVGEAADLFAHQLAGAVPTTACGTLERALNEAHAAARAGEVVLLSPASASFDQFRSFEHRGDVFRELVRARLAGGEA